MTHLKVIEGIKKEKPNYFLLYSGVFVNELELAIQKYATIKEYDKDTLKKLIWSGTKMIITSESRSHYKEDLLEELAMITSIDLMMSLLTPKEFETIFPIDKEYNGEKWGAKDYFYTRKYIEEFGKNKVIGSNIEEFLWEYLNHTIRSYVVKKMMILSSIRRIETGKGIMEEFLEEQGVPTYTMYEDDDGKKFLENRQTGEVFEVKKPRPKYLKVVK